MRAAVARADRLLHLVQQLRRRQRPVSAETLADELGVSIRSIYRDIQSLRAQGAEIAGEPGIGYVLKPGFLLPPLMFSDDEIEALVLGLQFALDQGDRTLGRAAKDAVGKLRAVLPPDLRHLIDDAGVVAVPAWGRQDDAIDLALVRRAIREQRKVELGYVDAKGEVTTRVIWPIAVAFHERVRTVVAWCELRQAYRTFRSDRIRDFVAQESRYPRPRKAMIREWRAIVGARPAAFE